MNGLRMARWPLGWIAGSLAGALALSITVLACDPRPPLRVVEESAAAAGRPAVTLTILHTNDMHARLLPDVQGRGGWARLAAMAMEIRQGRRDVLLLDAGDMTQGSPVGTIFKGVPIFAVMNAMGYDAAVLGNHEFDNGLALAAEYRHTADFPLLSANALLDGEPVADAAELILDVNGIRVGLIGLTTPSFAGESPALQDSGLIVADPIETARQAMARLAPRVDLVIALTHLGIDNDRELARQATGIDLIVGGHSHSLLEGPVIEGDTLIVQAGSQGRYLGRVDLAIDLEQGRITDYSVENLPVMSNAGPSDPATQAIIEEWESKVSDQVDIPIGFSEGEVGVDELRGHIGRIWRDAYGGDFGFQNEGGTRAGLPRGEISIREIYNALPFDDTIYILALDRGQIETVLGGADFRETKPLYSLVTNNYAGEQMIRRFGLPEDRVRRTGEPWREPVIRAIRENGGLEAPLARTGTGD